MGIKNFHVFGKYMVAKCPWNLISKDSLWEKVVGD